MASMTAEKQSLAPMVDAKSGVGFTLGLLLGAAAGGLFSMAVASGRDAVPESAIDLGRKVEQLKGVLQPPEAGE